MFRRFSANFALFSIALDLVLIGFAFITAVQIRPALSALPFAKDIPPGDQNIPGFIYLVFPLAWVVVLMMFTVYDGTKNLKLKDEIASLTIGSVLAAVALAGTLYLSYRDVSRLLFLFFILLAYFLLVTWRIAARTIIAYKYSEANQRRLLIVGAGTLGDQLCKQILKNPSYGLRFIGFLSDENEAPVVRNQVIGNLDDIKQVVNKKEITDVIIALPQEAQGSLNKLVAELHTLPVKVWIIPDYFHLALHTAVVEDFAGLPMLDLRAPVLSEYQRMIKRAFDILITILILPVALLLSILIAIAIYLEDKGQIIFSQERVGENGRIFTIYKFRSMRPGAENEIDLVEQYDEGGNLIHKRKDDPRVTRVGRYLRKTSLDELPQIINVLRGDMSLVGPRPELPELVDRYELWQRKRFAVPQGITGWWQVNGRSDRPMHLHTEDDLYYVQNYSIFLDLFILFKTFWVVLRGEGAF